MALSNKEKDALRLLAKAVRGEGFDQAAFDEAIGDEPDEPKDGDAK